MDPLAMLAQQLGGGTDLSSPMGASNTNMDQAKILEDLKQRLTKLNLPNPFEKQKQPIPIAGSAGSAGRAFG